MLFKKTVYEDRQGSETNIVQSQVYTIIERLKMERKIIFSLLKKKSLYLLKFISIPATAAAANH